MMSDKKTPTKNNVKDHTHMSGEFLLTPQGFLKLKTELDLLKNNRRQEIINRIEEALKLGDLKENAEYHDAKEEQGFVEGRILELEAMLNQAMVVEKKNGESIGIGSEFVCEMNNKEKTYTIVGAEEADPMHGRISHSSPIAQALLGRHIGETVEITTPAGVMQCKIIKIK